MQNREYLEPQKSEKSGPIVIREGVCAGVLKRVYTDDKLGQRYVTRKGKPYCKLVIEATDMRNEGGDLYHNLFDNQIHNFLYAVGRSDLYDRDVNVSFNNLKRLVESKFTFDLIKKKIKNKNGELYDIYNIEKFHSRAPANAQQEKVIPPCNTDHMDEIPF
jgi:hypothetical protein